MNILDFIGEHSVLTILILFLVFSFVEDVVETICNRNKKEGEE